MFFLLPISYTIITHPIPFLKLGSIGLHVALTRKFVLNQIVAECLIKKNYDRYRGDAQLTAHALLLIVSVCIWINSSFIIAHGVLFSVSLLVKILHVIYKRFTIKTHSPIKFNEEAVYTDVINIIASYSTSSMLDIMGVQLAGYPIDAKYLKEAIAECSKEDLQEFAKRLKLSYLNDRELFNQQIGIFFSFASIEIQDELYEHFNFFDNPDKPADAELGTDLLRALPEGITEFSIFPYAKKVDVLSVLNRCKKIKMPYKPSILGIDQPT